MSKLSKKIKIILIAFLSMLCVFIMSKSVFALSVGDVVTMGFENYGPNKYRLKYSTVFYCIDHSKNLDSGRKNRYTVYAKVKIVGNKATLTKKSDKKVGPIYKKANARLAYILACENYKFGYNERCVRQKALWGFWTTWLENAGEELGLKAEEWIGRKTKQKNKEIYESSSSAQSFVARSLEYANNFKNQESGAANIKIKFNNTNCAKKEGINRKQFEVEKKVGSVDYIIIHYKEKEDGKWSKEKKVKLLPGKQKTHFHYQQLGKDGKFGKVGIKSLEVGKNNYVWTDKKDCVIVGVTVGVTKKITKKPQVTISLLRSEEDRQPLIHVQHATDVDWDHKEDSDTKEKNPELEVIKYAGYENSDGKVVKTENKKLKFYLKIKTSNGWLFYNGYDKDNEDEKKNAKEWTSGDTIKLEAGKRYRLIEIKNESQGYTNKILKVKATEDGKEFTINKNDIDKKDGKIEFVAPLEKVNLEIAITDETTSKTSIKVRKRGIPISENDNTDPETPSDGKDEEYDTFEHNQNQNESDEGFETDDEDEAILEKEEEENEITEGVSGEEDPPDESDRPRSSRCY